MIPKKALVFRSSAYLGDRESVKKRHQERNHCINDKSDEFAAVESEKVL